LLFFFRRQVLAIYWKTSLQDAEDVMDTLHQRSLVLRDSSEPDSALSVYAVHSMLHKVLRKLSSQEHRRKFHAQLVENYLTKVQNDFTQLPHDNYIHWFLGYHLDRSKASYLLQLFPLAYLNLSFLTVKLKICGPADLLMDLEKYKKYINRDVSAGRA
jgi:APAF-1 helical domain